jgi:hypothetical protein
MLCTLPTARGALFSARKAAPQRSSASIKARLPCMVVRASQEQPEEKTLTEKLALPAAALLGAALLFAATPDEALAARSGGRVGGSSGFASRRWVDLLGCLWPRPRVFPACCFAVVSAPEMIHLGCSVRADRAFGIPPTMLCMVCGQRCVCLARASWVVPKLGQCLHGICLLASGLCRRA